MIAPVTGLRSARGPAIAALVLAALVLSVACTEPNPYLLAADASTGTSTSVAAESTTLATAGTAASSGPDDTSSGSGGEASCAEQGMTCVAAAPAGFLGPFAWLERPADAPAECPAPFARSLVEAFSELSAPAASCDCNCGPLNNAECGPAAVDRHAGVSCAGGAQSTRDLTAVCNPIGGAGWAANTSFFFDAPEVVGGGCLPLPNVEVEPAAFLTRHLACAAALEPAGCPQGQLCAPPPDDPFHARVCVWQEGDVACPERSDYVERTLLHREIDDQRGCEPCTCAVPPGPCEGTSAVLSTAIDCSVNTAAVPANDCVGGLGVSSIQSISYAEGTPPAECDAAVIVPTGDAAGSDPITFCCTA